MNRKNFLKIIPALGAGLIAVKHIKPEAHETANEACIDVNKLNESSVEIVTQNLPYCNCGEINKIYIWKGEENPKWIKDFTL